MAERLSVFGLGYVGCVSAVCLARMGHSVVGVDVNPAKVDLLAAGKSPIVEADIDELVSEMVASGRLTATSDVPRAVEESDISLVCVGTPSRRNGSLDLSYIRRVCEQIGQSLVRKARHHVVAIRSTALPGTMDDPESFTQLHAAHTPIKTVAIKNPSTIHPPNVSATHPRPKHFVAKRDFCCVLQSKIPHESVFREAA